MELTAIDTEINEQIQRLQDLNKRMGEIAQKIGALQEEGKALHSAALEVKGAIEGLAKLKMKEEVKAKELKDKLTLPDHSLVAPDGVTKIADANAPVLKELGNGVQVEAETAKAPVLEVVK